MRITFTPQRRADTLAASVAGDVLTINGEAFDFSGVGEGDILPADAISTSLIVHDVTRVAGELQITLILPHGADASEAARFPLPVTVTNGQIEVPV